MTHPDKDDHLPLTNSGARRIVALVVFLVLGWFILRSLHSVLLLFAVVFLIAMVLNPFVVWLEKHRVPRVASVVLVILAIVAIAVTVAVLAIPPLVNQVQELVRHAPDIWRNIRGRLDLLVQHYPSIGGTLPQTDDIAAKIGQQAGPVANMLVRSTLGVVGGLLSVLFALLLLIFVLSNPRPLVAGYLALAPDRYREQARNTLVRMIGQMHAWARGVGINGLATGFSMGTGLWLVGVQPALMFGVLSFLGEFIPNVGAFLVAIPILFVALSMGVTKFWLALVVILFVYQVELNLLVPVVLGKEMRLNPVVILFFTVAMGSLFGLLGAILAVPAAALVHIVIDEFYLRPRALNYAKIEHEAAAIVDGKK
jgi:putative permease